MILYFANRGLDILGNAQTSGKEGCVITDDVKEIDVATGTTTLSFNIYYSDSTRRKIEEMTAAGNRILCRSEEDSRDEVYTIIDTENDVLDHKINVYAEDDGLDLLNDIVSPFITYRELPISSYVSQVLSGTSFSIGINEIAGEKLLLWYETEQTGTERLNNIASDFGVEFGYNFEIDGLRIKSKKLNIYEKRGRDTGIQLRMGMDVKNIIAKESVANLATAIYPIGNAPEGTIGYRSYVQNNQQFYTWVKFAETRGGSSAYLSDSVGSNSFIGIALDKDDPVESDIAKNYTWYRCYYKKIVKVATSTVGLQYIPEEGDEDAKYMWIKFSKEETGTSMTDVPDKNTKYIGIAKNKKSTKTPQDPTGRTKSTDPNDYSWYKYAGSDADTLYLTSSDNKLADGRWVHICYGVYDDTTGNITSLSTSAVGKNAAGVCFSYSSTAPALSIGNYVWGLILEDGNPLVEGGYVEMEFNNTAFKVGGESTYTWIAFADDVDGENLTTNPKSKSYIGFAYKKNSVIPSFNASEYSWHRLSGDDASQITLAGYSFDRNGYYVDKEYLCSRAALDKWSRKEGSNQTGHLVRKMEYDADTQEELLALALQDLMALEEPQLEYRIELYSLPKGIQLGDRIYVVDDLGEIYIQSRVSGIRRSICNDTVEVTLSEFKKVSSGISDKFARLSAQFQSFIKKNQPVYTWTVYAEDNQGTGIRQDQTDDTNWMGIAENRYQITPDLSDPSIYSWVQIRSDDLESVKDITEYYAVNNDSTTPPAWNSFVETPIPQITESNPYLWNYEIVEYNNSETIRKDRHIIGVYGSRGGRGISVSSIVEHYLAYSSNTGVTRNTSGWDTIRVISAELPYLWNYTQVIFTEGNDYVTDPIVIGSYGEQGPQGIQGVQGEQGDDGRGVTNIFVEYYLSESDSTVTGGIWRSTPATYIAEHYYWRRERTAWDDGSPDTYSDPILDDALNNAAVAGVIAETATALAEEAQRSVSVVGQDVITLTNKLGNWDEVEEGETPPETFVDFIEKTVEKSRGQLQTSLQMSNDVILARIEDVDKDTKAVTELASTYLTSDGFYVRTAPEDEDLETITKIDSKGMVVALPGDGENDIGDILARFTKDGVFITNLRATENIRFGAHEIYAKNNQEYDGTTTMGTAWKYIGDVN